MFAVIRHYHFKKEDEQRIDQLIQEEFVPLLKQGKGFVRYYWLDTGEGEGASLSVSEDKSAPMNPFVWQRTLQKPPCRSFLFQNPKS